jgi:hypothetical protein
VVIEGWALRPPYVCSLSGDVSGLFLLADESLIKKRAHSSNFSEGAANVELVIERYCERSFWFNAYLRDKVMRLGLKALMISDKMTPNEIVDECMNLLDRDI